jgi:hypothetical protein
MDAALASGDTDLIGLARPFCVEPDFPRRLLTGSEHPLAVDEDHLVLGKRFWGPNSSSSTLRALNNQAQAGWYYHQITRLGEDQPPDLERSPLRAMVTHFSDDFVKAMRRKLA